MRFPLTSEGLRNTALVEQTSRNNLWHIKYILNGEHMDEDQLKELCSQYRLPHESFKELLQELCNHTDFAKWTPGRTNSAKNVLLLYLYNYLEPYGI